MEPEPLATLEELKGRLDWELDPLEETVATSALEDLSDDARYYGQDTWLTTETAPRVVCSLVLRAAARHMQNPNGYTQSRAGDETLTWRDNGPEAGSAHFTDREIKQLREMNGTSSLVSVPVTAWGSVPRLNRYIPKARGSNMPGWRNGAYGDAGYVPVDGNGDPFPMYADDEGGW